MNNFGYFFVLMILGVLFTIFGVLRLYFVSGIKKKGLIITGVITLIIWTFVSVYISFIK